MDTPTPTSAAIVAPPVVVKAPRSWTTIAVIVGLPVILIFVAWLISVLDQPTRWCSVTVTDGKIATSTIKDCTSIALALIEWLGRIAMSLVGCAAIVFIVIALRDLKATADVKLLGLSLRAGADPATLDTSKGKDIA